MQEAGGFFDFKKPPAACLAKLAVFEDPNTILLQSSSLTAQIKQLDPAGFRLKIVKISLGTLSNPNLPRISAQTVVVRDVYLCCKSKRLVFARSFLPLSSLKGYWHCLKSLKRPLGEVLFQHGHVRRECLGFYKVVYPKVCLGRLLRFYLPTGPIWVTEWMALKKDISTPY